MSGAVAPSPYWMLRLVFPLVTHTRLIVANNPVATRLTPIPLEHIRHRELRAAFVDSNEQTVLVDPYGHPVLKPE